MATTAMYKHRGEALDFKNSTAELIPADTIIVIGAIIGVTGSDISPGQTGALHVTGVFKIKKTGTAAIQQGQTVYFDGTGITDVKSTNTEVGYAAAPAEAADAFIQVKLRG